MALCALPDSILRVVGERTLVPENAGRSGAQVWYAGRDLVIKIDRKGRLARTAALQRFLYEDGFSPEVVYFESGEQDILVSARAIGESAISAENLAKPELLAGALGRAAKRLHALPFDKYRAFPLTEGWKQNFDAALRSGAKLYEGTASYLHISSPEEAAREAEKHAHLLKDHAVVHGDLCLPNFMLKDFSVTALIDVGDAGFGDRHYDLFWALWSLAYNLKTDEYAEVFLKAYGKEDADERLIRTCGCLCALED